MLGLLFGIIIGFSLGLTGAGGSVLAVPLLVYAMEVPVHQAVGISLATVGATALYGSVNRIISGEADLGTGLIFGAGGILGAPLGTWLGTLLPGGMLLGGFALLMAGVAIRMWYQASRQPDQTLTVRASAEVADGGPVCHRDPDSGRLGLTSPCALVLLAAGLATGLLSGLFGVGGGFVIVPALLMVASLPIGRAVATSLVVITIVSAAGTLAHALAGQPFDGALTGLFILGGLVGMGLGIRSSRRLAGPTLQRIFATTLLLLAVYMLSKNLF